jgi:hypothetical protein
MKSQNGLSSANLRLPNTAMHLIRHSKAIFIAEHFLRPGDGERYAASITV